METLSGMTTGTTAVALLTTSAAGPVGFFTRPNAVSRHSHFHPGLAGTLTSDPDHVAELVPDAVALKTGVPVGYVPAAPPVQPVKLVGVVPVHVTTSGDPTEIGFDPELKEAVLTTLIVVEAGSVETGLVVVVPSKRFGSPG